MAKTSAQTYFLLWRRRDAQGEAGDLRRGGGGSGGVAEASVGSDGKSDVRGPSEVRAELQDLEPRARLDAREFMEGIRSGAAGSMALELFAERMLEKDFRLGVFAEYQVRDLGMGVDVVEAGDHDVVVVFPGASLWK
ncbi:hypothetical protein Fmac_010552 [Flemingia macrophylla]|uniref:Uncharacterized protein n=1 Tax=Flemingia macrophylla TaxID=520843 RepID=A0ABD1MK63_9FABA